METNLEDLLVMHLHFPFHSFETEEEKTKVKNTINTSPEGLTLDMAEALPEEKTKEILERNVFISSRGLSLLYHNMNPFALDKILLHFGCPGNWMSARKNYWSFRFSEAKPILDRIFNDVPSQKEEKSSVDEGGEY